MNILDIPQHLLDYVRQVTSHDWQADAEPLTEEEIAECTLERAACEARPTYRNLSEVFYPVVDFREKAAEATYSNGRNKLTRYRRNDLSKLRVILALHQTGFERSERRLMQSAWRITASRVIGPTGQRYRNFPLDVRLISTNRLDRAPWACIPLEFVGNFERIDGTGTWWAPDRFGRGRATEDQIMGGRAEILAIDRALDAIGVDLWGIAPHIVAGRDKRGNPNRHACCASRLWSEVGEWAGAMLGLRIPGPGWSCGGLPIPPEWYGPYHDQCTRFFA